MNGNEVRSGKKGLCLSLALLILLNVLLISSFQNADAAAYKQGSTGGVVKQIQQKLSDLGYYTYTVDGIYGSRTVAAVKRFQQWSGLPQNGRVDSGTWNMLVHCCEHIGHK